MIRIKNESERFELLTLMEIEWWDASTFYGKFMPSEIDGLSPAIGKIVGYLLKETDDYYIVTPMIFIDRPRMSDECDDVKFIPKNGVISVNLLETKIIEDISLPEKMEIPFDPWTSIVLPAVEEVRKKINDLKISKITPVACKLLFNNILDEVFNKKKGR